MEVNMQHKINVTFELVKYKVTHSLEGSFWNVCEDLKGSLIIIKEYYAVNSVNELFAQDSSSSCARLDIQMCRKKEEELT